MAGKLTSVLDNRSDPADSDTMPDTDHAKKTFAPPIHWLLLAVYPPVLLYAANTDRFGPEVVAKPVLIITVTAAALWGLLTLMIKNGRKAALLVSLLLVAIFSYGHVARLTGNPHWFIAGIHVGHDKLLIPIYLLTLIVLTGWTLRTTLPLRTTTRVLNFLSALLLLVAVGQVGYAHWTQSATQQVIYPAPPAPKIPPTKVLPDIYYIIADGYGRSDVLQELYGFDNSSFLDHLRGKGFVIADGSLANYPQTALSLASSLNMTYLDELGARFPNTSDRRPAQDLVSDNALFRFLHQRNYRVVCFATGAGVTPRRNVDVWLSGGIDFGEFGEALLAGTPLPAILHGMRQHQVHRNRIRYTLETLPQTTEMDPPIFVLAHIFCPHPPFVFNADGSPTDPDREFTVDDGSHFLQHRNATRDEYLEGYRAQVAFMDRELTKAVDAILARSTRPTLIIIQGDHGPGAYLNWESAADSKVRERLSILNAYYLPQVGDVPPPQVHPQITPVNTFRLILSHYFGADTPLLENNAFFATVERPYRFTDVTARCRPAAATQASQSAPDIPPRQPSPTPNKPPAP